MANDILTIDGITYAVNITSLKETSEFLDKYANRSEDGVLKRGLIGVYFNHELTLAMSQDRTVMQALWTKINEPVEFHTVKLPHNDGFLTYSAYVTGSYRNLFRRKDGTNWWGGFTIKFIAQKPALTP